MKLFLQSSKPLPETLSQFEVTANLPQPPFPHLLRSNIPPTESETSLIRDVITMTEVEESRLKELAASGSHTESDRVNCELDRTRQYIVEHNAILSYIRRIPPEVLQCIFLHTLPTTIDDSIPRPRVVGISQLPWALSQVCQLWRNTMLSFSVMWRDLPIINLNETYSKEEPYLDFLTEVLKRSHNTPIRLVVVGNGKEHIAHPAIDMLVLHSDRWQEIKIHALFALLPAFHNIDGRLSSLQSLSLSLYSRETINPISYTPHDLFLNAPKLRYVELMGPTNDFNFPAHQFVHYCQTVASFDQLVRVLFSSPSLKILRFYGFQHGQPSTLPMTALSLPDLTVLDAYFYLLTPFQEAFFDNLTVPAIEELRVEAQAEDIITPLCSMILRSGSLCLLKVLHLRLRFTPGELPSLLRLTPLLTHLSITLPSTRDIFTLVLDGSTPPLVPLLTECEFLSDRDAGPSSEAILALKVFASSRCELPDDATSAAMLESGATQTLQTLRIHFGRRSNRYRQEFEGWVSSDMTEELVKQRERLFAMLPELGLGDIPFKRKFDLKWKNKVTGLLTHLESLKIEKASDICVSDHSIF